MRKHSAVLFVVIITLAFAQQGPPPGARRGPAVAPLEESGFRQIFDGKSLTGWDCDADFWRVENGVMIGETSAGHQPKQNIFCIWKGGSPEDFELKGLIKNDDWNENLWMSAPTAEMRFESEALCATCQI